VTEGAGRWAEVREDDRRFEEVSGGVERSVGSREKRRTVGENVGQ
jgi:hypothetical protein